MFLVHGTFLVDCFPTCVAGEYYWQFVKLKARASLLNFHSIDTLASSNEEDGSDEGDQDQNETPVEEMYED